MKLQELKSGDRFGRLIVIKLNHIKNRSNKYHNTINEYYYLCKCDCGNTIITDKNRLVNGRCKSCGCLQKEKAKETQKINCCRHNLYYTRLYKTWINMKTRCYNKNCKNYKNYGGRNIKVCDEWINDFMSFYNWSINNGYQDNLTIDRIDVNGNYEPNNCKWSTKKEQARNRRNNVIIDNMCLKEYWEKNNINLSYGYFQKLIKNDKYEIKS